MSLSLKRKLHDVVSKLSRITLRKLISVAFIMVAASIIINGFVPNLLNLHMVVQTLGSFFDEAIAFVTGTMMKVRSVWDWYSMEARSPNGAVTHPNAEIINPITAFVAAAIVAWAALQQARTAARRHYAQTEADRQRRLTESFSKAIEQLGSDKVEVRLGGIYSLERISQESPSDYWTVMENLTAFVRERTARIEAEQPFEKRMEQRAYFLWDKAGRPERQAERFWVEAIKAEQSPTDIAAVLTVIKRRSVNNRKIEARNGWLLDLRNAGLRGADLRDTYLEDADLSGAHLECADLSGAEGFRAA